MRLHLGPDDVLAGQRDAVELLADLPVRVDEDQLTLDVLGQLVQTQHRPGQIGRSGLAHAESHDHLPGLTGPPAAARSPRGHSRVVSRYVDSQPSMTLPGLRIPYGSSARRTARCSSATAGESSAGKSGPLQQTDPVLAGDRAADGDRLGQDLLERLLGTDPGRLHRPAA